jgi:hypothetical protein
MEQHLIFGLVAAAHRAVMLIFKVETVTNKAAVPAA